jgi:hypothetical protein
MKLFYKITISIALISMFLIFTSFPDSPVATLGERIFGDYKTYLGALLSVFVFSVLSAIINFIWKTF